MIREFFETIGELMRVSSKTGCWCTLVPTYQVTWRRHGNSLPKTATLTSESSLSAPLSFRLYLTCFFPVTLSFSFSFYCLSSFASFCPVAGLCFPFLCLSSFLFYNSISLVFLFFLFLFLPFIFPVTISTLLPSWKISVLYINYCTHWIFAIIEVDN